MSTPNFAAFVAHVMGTKILPFHRLLSGTLLFVFVLFLSLPALSQKPPQGPSIPQLGIMEGENITVRFQGSLQGAAKNVVTIYPLARKEVSERLGLKAEFRPFVTLLADQDLFQSLTGNRFIVAFAVPAQRHVVIDYSKIGARPWTLEAVLKHEFCHLLLHDQLGKNIPKWLDEGVCQWVSEGAAEILLQQKATILHQAAISGQLYSLSHLTRRFPDGGTGLILAYEESRSIVDYIADRHGPEGLRGLIDRLRNGEDIEQAFFGGFSVSLQDLEKSWRKSLRSPVYWLYAVSSYLYEILFFAASVAAIWGFIAVMRRRKARRALEPDDF